MGSAQDHGDRMMTYGTTRGRHDAIAQAIADRPYLMFSGWDDYADERGWKGVGIAPCGRHRDSDALVRSNFDTVNAALDAVDHDGHDIADFSHWAVGWIDEITYDLGNADMGLHEGGVFGADGEV